MTTSDIRPAARCPTNVGTLGSFVTRSQGESNLLRLGDALIFGIFTDETFSLICEHGWPEILGYTGVLLSSSSPTSNHRGNLTAF
ncbi:MAG: hypothetical protein CL726_08795 [Chloroflexi bacterium]|nr:hypothetical protein [Chloroflexota bacterium]